MSAPASQELPPPGGYSRIIFERTPTKKILNGRWIVLGYFGTFALGLWGSREARYLRRRQEAEQRSGHIAVQPFLVAEMDRMQLKQIKKNIAAEADLMKNVKNWEVGTFFGTSVYSTIDPNEWVDPSEEFWFVHSDLEEASKYFDMRLYH